jgi:hypothetical protein
MIRELVLNVADTGLKPSCRANECPIALGGPYDANRALRCTPFIDRDVGIEADS